MKCNAREIPNASATAGLRAMLKKGRHFFPIDRLKRDEFVPFFVVCLGSRVVNKPTQLDF